MKYYDFIEKAPPLENLIVIEGTDRLLSERTIAAIVERLVDPSVRELNVEQFAGPTLESPSAVEAACTTLPFLANQRVVVVRDAQGMRVAARRALWEAVARIPPGNTLVIEDLQSPQKRSKPETFGQLAGSRALRIDVTASQPMRARFARETLAALGATAAPAVFAMLAAGDGDLAAVRSDLDKLALSGHVTVDDVLRETLSSDDVKVYHVAAALVAGRFVDALSSADEFFAAEGASVATRLFAAIAGEYQLVWECARRGGELPPKQRWRERELRSIARRIGQRGARRGFKQALAACEAAVGGRLADARGVVALLAARAAASGREDTRGGTTASSNGRRAG